VHCPGRSVAEIAARLGCGAPDAAAAGIEISGVTLGSASVRPGDLYAALPGRRVHGARFVPDAVAAGAAAVLTDPDGRRLLDEARSSGGGSAADGDPVPVLVVPEPRALLGELAAWIYGEPGRRLTGYGVTGTNGKTTTTFLLDSALRRLGERTGLIGTIEIRVAGERVTSTGTTPEAPDLHALLAVMVEHGVTSFATEVSSHALDQHRVDGLVLDVAAFTNLSQDHLDYHGTMEDYFAAKAQLFTPAHSRTGVICVDDAWGRRAARSASVPVTTVTTLPGIDADWRVLERRPAGAGTTRVGLAGPAGSLELTCPLPGDFNVANAVLALALLVAGGHDVHAAAAAIEAAGTVPGRMERVLGTGAAGEPLAIVDFAHTPEAVSAALGALAGRGRPLVVVLGAGGERDPGKRPLMGAAAARRADVVLVTDDNPRSEDPADIRAAVLAGARAAAGPGVEVVEVAGRGHAIAEGVARAWHGGVLLVAGKGHESGQDVGGEIHPFDDREVVGAALRSAAGVGLPGALVPQKETAP
jgi:UDP-N-acetylmuramoyl-L-alanyl-D-glutamate--2,6-diaminopimelate ligase